VVAASTPADAAPVAPPPADAAPAPATFAIGPCTALVRAGDDEDGASGRDLGGAAMPPPDGIGIGGTGGIGGSGYAPPPHGPPGGRIAAQNRLTMTLGPVGPGVDKLIVERYLRRHQNRFRYCHERILVTDPSLTRASLRVKFIILPTGLVASVTATGDPKELRDCVGSAVRAIVFPKPQPEQPVPVAVTMKFEAAGAAPPARRPRPKLDVARATEALRSRAEALRACLPPGALGGATLSIQVSSKGAVIGATVDGMPDAKVAACLADAAKATTLPAGAAGRLRCPLTFGG
jgi:hypothetical protein